MPRARVSGEIAEPCALVSGEISLHHALVCGEIFMPLLVCWEIFEPPACMPGGNCVSLVLWCQGKCIISTSPASEWPSLHPARGTVLRPWVAGVPI